MSYVDEINPSPLKIFVASSRERLESGYNIRFNNFFNI
jgi:hypothetical protein